MGTGRVGGCRAGYGANRGSVGINERWEIARRVTLDPIISTVDPDVGVIASVALTNGGGPGDGDVASGHRPTNTRRWTAKRGG